MNKSIYAEPYNNPILWDIPEKNASRSHRIPIIIDSPFYFKLFMFNMKKFL